MQQIEIRIKGQIDLDWSDWMGGLAISHTGQGETVLKGSVRDQAALYGLLNKLNDLGIQLVSVAPAGANGVVRLRKREEPRMHIQLVDFSLKEMSEAEFHKMCDEVAPAFAAVPGLISKVWLADPVRNAYGGVYTWRDRHAMVAYSKSDLYQAVATNLHLANLASRDFAVLEGPTRVTHGLIAATV